jgi:hypothetical protein
MLDRALLLFWSLGWLALYGFVDFQLFQMGAGWWRIAFVTLFPLTVMAAEILVMRRLRL